MNSKVIRSLVRGLAASLALGAFSAARLSAAPHEFQVGDVICGVTSGEYKVYNNAGGYIETIYDGLGGVTTGAYFLEDYYDPPGTLYITDLTFGDVVVLDGATGHSVLMTIDPSLEGDWACESVVFDEDDNFYVGHVGGSQDIQKYDSSGSFVEEYDVETGPAGSDWLDLACDQSTMFYTSEGPVVRRYDLSTSTQLPDFATGLPNDCFALRLLPPYDGTNGLIVSNRSSVLRLDDTGAIAQVYDVSGEDFWFSINLDPNGSSFWAGDLGTANFYRFEITSGAVEIGPINTGTGYGTFAGLAVVGEPTGGSNDAPIFEQAPCGDTIAIAAGEGYAFVVSCVDPDPGDSITLTASGVPPGATHTPALPLFGAPDEDLAPVFEWFPEVADIGTYTLLYNLTDAAKGAEADCTVGLDIYESYLVVGTDEGSGGFSAGGHTFVTHISQIREWHVATTDNTPVFRGPPTRKAPVQDGQLGGGGSSGSGLLDNFRVQALMHDPLRFPNNPEQFSSGLNVRVWKSGLVSATPYGNRDGLQLALETFVGANGENLYRFRISIDGQ